MAILWQKKIDGRSYEVRSAGRTRRLYTNGVCHSEYNPSRILTGSVWDLLLLPVFFMERPRGARILVLGVGGGAALLQLKVVVAPDLIQGVELDPVHLYVANRFFAAAVDGIELVQADARQWVEDYGGSPFDVIIDDLFTDERSEPVRAVECDPQWCRQLVRHLRDDGVLIINFASSRELHACGLFSNPPPGRAFRSAFQLSMMALDNAVGAFTRQYQDASVLRTRLDRVPLLRRNLRDRRLRFRIRTLDFPLREGDR